jgi:hypothetical protein
MVWPDRSWIFSKLLGDETTRWVATVLLVIVAIAFLTGGVGLFIRQPWWRSVVLAAVVFSSTLFLLLWDGKVQELPEKGGVGILINLAILVIVYLFKWPV